MFYSHAFLARKSPLGTVWIAAFRQHKLRKSHVAIINISSSVDHIMFPEVPIALRLSGHLLLGVVQIYSKKVQYLYHDCNVALTQILTTFASVHVNLPEDANRATFQAVTLPAKFELDAIGVDDNDYGTGNTDNHVKTREQITLPDQIPAGGDQYVSVIINEDRIEPSPHPGENPGIEPMEADAHPPCQVGQDLPSAEAIRDVMPESQDPINDISGPNENSDHITGKASLSPSREPLPHSGVEYVPSSSHPDALSGAVASAEYIENFNTMVSREPHSPGFVLRSSPSVGRQKAKSRKRKTFFDECLVLLNAEIKKQLADTTELKRRRVKLPCSSLAVLKFQKSRPVEQLFHEPVLSGLCHQLQETYKKTFPAFGVDSIHFEAPTEDAHAPSPFPGMDIEIEQPGHRHTNLPESIHCPSGEGPCTPILPSNLGSSSQTGKTLKIDVIPTMETPNVPEPVVFQHETPPVQLEENLIPEIPGLANSPEEDDLMFLEADNTPTSSETNVIDSMSVRTRAVAQYLKWQSPVTQLSENQAGSLSLNRILEGKTRKQCARMFFETLVLKSCGFIEVHEEEPYGDITVSLTSTLSELKI